MTLNGYVALNSVFAPVWLSQTARLSKNNCVKTNKDRHVLSAAQMFGWESSFWRYKVCGLICFVGDYYDAGYCFAQNIACVSVGDAR